jgi:hypothetical protein
LALIIGTVVMASDVLVTYDNPKPPTMSLPVAYQHAETLLNSATNQFHCVSATITSDSPHGFSSPAWVFTFFSTNNPPKIRVIHIMMETNNGMHDLISR